MLKDRQKLAASYAHQLVHLGKNVHHFTPHSVGQEFRHSHGGMAYLCSMTSGASPGSIKGWGGSRAGALKAGSPRCLVVDGGFRLEHLHGASPCGVGFLTAWRLSG